MAVPVDAREKSGSARSRQRPADSPGAPRELIWQQGRAREFPHVSRQVVGQGLCCRHCAKVGLGGRDAAVPAGSGMGGLHGSCLCKKRASEVKGNLTVEKVMTREKMLYVEALPEKVPT